MILNFFGTLFNKEIKKQQIELTTPISELIKELTSTFTPESEYEFIPNSIPKDLPEWGGPRRSQPHHLICKLLPRLEVCRILYPQIQLGL
jgi:hypothetical protein